MPGAEYVRELLKDLTADPVVVKRTIFSLDRHDLTGFGLRAFYLNFLAVFGEIRSIQEIYQQAESATRNKLWCGWEYHSYLARLGQGSIVPELPNFPLDQIKQVLSQGRGLVLTGFQYGACRYLASYVAQNALPITIALSEDTYEQYFKARSANTQVQHWRYLKIANVEAPGGVIALARALARGEIVAALADGNYGTDGPYNKSGRLSVDFLGYKALVKAGFARLSALSGAPILPVLAPTGEGDDRCEVWPIIDPGTRLRGEAAQAFAAIVVQDLYKHFEHVVIQRPCHWGHGHTFHRWRQPQAAINYSSGVSNLEVEDALALGKIVALNGQRIIEIRSTKEIVWTDVRTLKNYRIPERLTPIVDKLASGGVTLDWLKSKKLDSDNSITTFLSSFFARKALQVMNRA